MPKNPNYDRRFEETPQHEGEERFLNQQTYEQRHAEGRTQDHGTRGYQDVDQQDKRDRVRRTAEAREKALRESDADIHRAMNEYAERGEVTPYETFPGELEVEVTDERGDWLGDVDRDPKMAENLRIERLIRRRMNERLKRSQEQWKRLKLKLKTTSAMKRFFWSLRREEGSVDYVSRDGDIVRPSEMRRYRQLVRMYPYTYTKTEWDRSSGKSWDVEVVEHDTLDPKGIDIFFEEVLATEKKSKRMSWDSGVQLGIPALASERAFVARQVRQEQQQRTANTQRNEEERTREMRIDQVAQDREENLQEDIRKGWAPGEEYEIEHTEEEVHAMDVAQSSQQEEEENRKLKKQASKEKYFGRDRRRTGI